MKSFNTIPAPNWAYGGFVMNSGQLGIGTVYYGAAYLLSEGPVYDPAANGPYTPEKLAAIAAGAKEGAEGYRFDLPANAVMGISAAGTEKCFWYDAENAGRILSHADALTLNASTGELTTAGGENVAQATV